MNFATTAPDGSFRIANVPAGRYRLAFEHERLAAESIEVVVVENQETVAVFDGPSRKRR